QPGGDLGRVEGRDHVKKLTFRFESLKAMGEALRDIERTPAAGGKLDALPLAAGRRIRSQIDRHIPHGSAQAADQLRFFMRRPLKMEAAQRASPAIEGNADLGELRLEPVLRELVGAPAPREPAALVLVPFHIDEAQ